MGGYQNIMPRPLAIIVLLACMAPGLAQEAPQEPVEVSIGVSALYHLDSVTVVYPSGPGEDLAVNRRSAEHRAGYLAETYGIEAAVAADGEIGEAELKGNLLVLGWNNRLLRRPGAGAPFHRKGDRILFLGLTVSGPDVDLVFLHESPFSPDAILVFWSRIDPELDRARILPSLGSDWAIYDRYRAITQGMFLREEPWPPVRNRNAEIDHRPKITEYSKALHKFASDHYDILYSPDTFTAKEVESIAAARETALQRASKVVGGIPEDLRISLSLYRDAEDKYARTEARGEVHTISRNREMHMTPRYARSVSAHEEIHVLAREHYGPAFLTSTYEGLSFSHERTIRGQDLDVHGALMVEAGKLPRLGDLLDELKMTALPGELSFPAAGLMMSWLRAHSGPEGVRKVYSLPGGGVEALARMLDSDPDTLEKAFSKYVSDLAGARKADVAYLDAIAKAAEAHKMGDYPGIVVALRKALKIRPGDPEALFNLAAAQLRIGEYDDCERNLLELLEAGLPESHTFVVFAHFQLGRMYDIQGKRELALARYRRMLELPDIHNSHRSAREAIETPFTADRLE